MNNIGYEVIDNFLDKEYFDAIKTALTSDDISWFYRDNLTSNNDESGMFYFTHNFFYNNTVSSPFFANFNNSSSGELLSLFAIEGKIGFDFLGLKLNLK